MTGGSIFALTAWMALIGMWAGAGLIDRLLDSQAATPQPSERVVGTHATMRAP